MTSGADGFVIREARAADSAALIELEKRTPLLVGELAVTFDRSPDYFAGSCFQERVHHVLAEYEGRPVGACGSALHHASFLGHDSERLLAYTFRERIDPPFQRRGLGRALAGWLQQRWKDEGLEPAGSYAFIDARNEASLAFAAAGDGPGPWPIDAWLQELPPIEAGPPAVALTAADADDVVALLNATHEGLELYRRYTRERLLARLNRSPAYGWAQWRGIRDSGRLVAVAGFYDQGEQVAFIARHRSSGETVISRNLVVLDYGFASGHEEAMLSVLAAGQTLAAAMGRNVLELSVPECSPLYRPVMEQAADFIRFKFLGGRELPPAGYRLRGIHIDPAYL